MHTILTVLIATITISCLADSSTPQRKNWILLGVETGLLNKGSVTSPEIDNSGFEIGFKGVWSQYRTSWVTDVGFGWRSDSMENNGVKVSTKAFFGDLGLRYRLTETISLGPSVTGLFGQDVSFSDVGTNSDEKSFSAFAGVRAMYDIFHPDEKRVFRFGINANTDLNIENRQITAVQLILEMGWPLDGDPIVAKEETKPIRKKRRRKRPLKLNLMNAGVRFASGSARLVGKSKSIISNVAKVLAKYKGQWSNITVEGHTDSLGDYRKNIQLSRSRAETVKRTLVQFGLNESLVNTTGYGPDKPLDERKNRTAYAKNRRVELRITGTNATEKFQKALEAVLKK